MEGNHHFDKRGFLFFIKFTSSILLLVILTYYSANAFSDNTTLTKFYNTANADTQLAVIAQNRQEILQGLQDRADSVEKENAGKRSAYLGFVGDIMLDRTIEKVIMESGYEDFSFPFDFLENRLKRYDILFGNLEGPVSDKGRDLGSIYSFRMDPKAIDSLKSMGFDILSVANNHAGDWGWKAMTDTYSRLKKADIIYSGGGFTENEAYTPRIVELNELKIAYVSFSKFGKGYLEATGNNPGIAVISDKKLKDSINIAKEQADIVVVSFHYGDEYKKQPNEYQETISKSAIDYGADLVVGHHPHVPEPVVKYKDGYIAYSLGNFIFDQNIKGDGSDIGLILEAYIEDGKIIEVKEIKVKFNYMFQPFVVN